MPSKLPTFTYRASIEALRRLNWLADHAGCSAATWITRAVHRAYDEAQRATATRNEEATGSDDAA